MLFCWPLCLPSCCFAVLLAPVSVFLLFCRSAGPCACLPAVLPFCWPLCLPSCCFAVLLASVPAFLLFCCSAGFCACLLAVLLAYWLLCCAPCVLVYWATAARLFSLSPSAWSFVFRWLHCFRAFDLCCLHLLAFMFLVAQLSVLVVHADILLINALSFFSFIYIV